MKINGWLNLAASISVLIGLGFVGYELRQNNVLAQAESTRELFNQDIERVKFSLQSDYSQLMKKSIDDPMSLTDDEIERLDKFMQINMQHHLNIAVMSDEFDLALLSTEEIAIFVVDDFLGGRFGRGWFNSNREWIGILSPALTSAIDQELDRTPVQLEYTWPAQIRSSIMQVTDD